MATLNNSAPDRPLKRLCANLFSGPWLIRRYFSQEALTSFEEAVIRSEDQHSGEIVVAIEANLTARSVIKGVSSRARSIKVFSDLKIWDTERNCGVLFYLLLAERAIEIVADRGVKAVVPDSEWESICRAIEGRLRERDFDGGIILGIELITEKLRQSFPPDPTGRKRKNELPDRPNII